ncbi:hypothetical protein HZS_1268, partial [Henneguya salminicola]
MVSTRRSVLTLSKNENLKTAIKSTKRKYNKNAQDSFNKKPQNFNKSLPLCCEQPTKHGLKVEKKKNTLKNNFEKKRKFLSDFENTFPNMMLQLECGFNLLFYGPGSKTHALNSFRSFLNDYNYSIFVIHGFNIIDIKKIEATFTQFEKLSTNYKIIFILCIDLVWGHSREFGALSKIMNSCVKKNIGLVASFDNINSSLVWNLTDRAFYRWVYHPCITFENYCVETKNSIPIMTMGNKENSVNALTNVISSLPEKSKSVFNIIAENYISSKNKNKKEIMEFDFLYNTCRSQFIISNEHNLRTILVELFDHKILKSIS